MGSQAKAHVLMIAAAGQGHVGPLMKLAHLISDHGIKVTIVNSHFIHGKIMTALNHAEDGKPEPVSPRIELVSVPDGPDRKVMPGNFKDLIEKINRTKEDEKVTCVVADIAVWWAFEVAATMGIKSAAFWPGAPGNLALALHVPKLIESRIIDIDGSPLKNELIQLAEDIPTISSTNLWWNSPDDPKMRKFVFGYIFRVDQAVKLSNWLLCNSFYELDSSAYNLIPNILPIGPLLATNHPSHSAANFWPVDSTCLKWLDKHPAGSVIYVAFGSLAILNQHQFSELARGLELVGRPFLWVVRSDGPAAEFPDGFMERVSENGKIVSWADQEKVLAHPSVACFLSHCGWNSTMEGVSMGVPFLCWPQSTDQFFNRVYICDIWKVGLELGQDGNGVISRHEIKTKIEKLVSDDGIKANALKLKEMGKESVRKDGSSSKNFKAFIEAMKQC